MPTATWNNFAYVTSATATTNGNLVWTPISPVDVTEWTIPQHGWVSTTYVAAEPVDTEAEIPEPCTENELEDFIKNC